MRIIYFLLIALCFTFTTSPSLAKETAFDRIKRTNTIRCGYINYPPYVHKDLNTGKFEGLLVELMAEIGKALDYQIDWTEETGYGDFTEGLNSRRFDMFCAVLGPLPPRAKEAWFTEPIWYEAMYVYTQSKNAGRFQTKEDLNKPDMTSLLVDGEIFWFLNQKTFPKAKVYSLPNMTPSSMVFIDLGAGKADFAIHGYQAFTLYNKNNPGKIIRAIKDPIHIAPISMAVPLGDTGLKYLMDITLNQLSETGVLEQLFQKYNMPPDVALRRRLPYLTPPKK